VTLDQLRAVLATRPRVALGTFPTPLDYCPRLTQAVGGPEIYIKRDDLTGLALGGNKTRNLEFLLGEALAQGADCVITGADTQSNQCRQAAAACAKLGLECYLVLSRGLHNEVQGNLLLDYLFGAHVRIVDVDLDHLQPYIDQVVEELRAKGKKPYRITGQYPELSAKAALGYLSAVAEMEEQFRTLPRPPAAVVVTSGSGTTQSGLATAVKALGTPYRVIGVSIKDSAHAVKRRIADRSQLLADFSGLPCRLTPDEVDVRDEYLGKAYGHITPEAREAIQLVARTEGILLDPVYTGKTMAGLIDLAHKGEFKAGEVVVMVHTGGIPALFAYHRELAQ